MNPFEQLRADQRPVAPDTAFAARLRRRVATALSHPLTDVPTIDLPERTPTMSDTPATDTSASDTSTTETSTTDAPTTEARGAITAYITVHDAAAAIEWYTTVLGAVETTRYAGDDGRIGHADLRIGGAALMLSDEYPDYEAISPRTLGGTSAALHLSVGDVDAVWAAAIEHGAIGRREPEDQPYGERSSTFVDPFGHRWMVASPIATPSIEEIQAASPGYTITASGTGVARTPVELGYLTMGFDDTAAASRFYGELFGWHPEQGSAGEGYVHIANTDLPLGFTPDGSDSSPTLYFRVDDAAAMADRVRELGGTVLAEATYPSGGDVACRDDQGREFHLWQPAPGY